MPAEMLRHFLRGYSDGDGCFTSSGHKAAPLPVLGWCLLGTQDFLEGVKASLRGAGVPVGGKVYRRKGGRIFALHARTGVAYKVGEFLYCGASMYLERKRAVWEAFAARYSKEAEGEAAAV